MNPNEVLPAEKDFDLYFLHKFQADQNAEFLKDTFQEILLCAGDYRDPDKLKAQKQTSRLNQDFEFTEKGLKNAIFHEIEDEMGIPSSTLIKPDNSLYKGFVK